MKRNKQEKFMKENYLVLVQSREESGYNDFIGRAYHFPKKYLGQFKNLPVEFIYYEPTRSGGQGVYFGCGKIKQAPKEDKREHGHYFVEVDDYKAFAEPVPLKDLEGNIREVKSKYYNSQNAVRQIPAGLFEEICLDGKVILNFRADAHLVRVLGEQLIGSEKVGILELIKNAYDAGASYCRIRIENVPSLGSLDKSELEYPKLPGPVIIIEDDGSGMTREVIEHGWLRPASTIKTVVKEQIKHEREKAAKSGKLGTFDRLISELKKERGGRIPLGEKGVGRFAAHRLGKHLMLKTKVSDLDYEYILEVDWDDFNTRPNEVTDLEKVGIALTRQSPSRDYGSTNSGTQLVIYGGREGFYWDKDTIEELHRSVIGLNSPHPSPGKQSLTTGFNAFLECPQLGELPTDSPVDQFPATFSFDGLVDERGALQYELKFNPPRSVPMPGETFKEKNVDLRKFEADYWADLGKGASLRTPACGQFFLHIDVWYRRTPWVTVSGPDGKNFIDYLTKFGGISIFRDGLNIFPAEWGAETDWLDLSKTHIKQGFRMSYYNMIGNLEVDQTQNIHLVDKTDREGLIGNRAFSDLTKLVRSIISSIIEVRFIGKREEYGKLTESVVRDPKLLADYAKQGAKVIDGIKDNYPIDKDPYNILGSMGGVEKREDRLVSLSTSLRNLQKSIKLLQESQDLLTEQAGYGMAVAVSVHEIAKIAANFYYGVTTLLKAKQPSKEKLDELKKASASLQSELRRLGPVRAIKTESPTQFGVLKAIRYTIDINRSKLEKASIKIKIGGNQDFSVYGRYGAVIQIFSNLIDNSWYWLKTVTIEDRSIVIEIDESNRMITVADSGPGIGDVIMPYLFQPGYSMRIPPSGLGLYICRYYMQQMKGDIYLTSQRDRIKNMAGAQFTLDFGRVPDSRETEGNK
ncbi:MAG: sensor histidine kinase [Candidatus Zixiibacteriota bacterium]